MVASLQVVSDRTQMDTDKQKALDAALAQIDRAFGKGSAMRLGSRNRGPGKLPAPFEDVPIEIWGQTREEWRARRGSATP